MTIRVHAFGAVAFEESFVLREFAGTFPGCKITPHALSWACEGGGDAFLYPFGAVVSHDVESGRRESVLDRMRRAVPLSTTKLVSEDYVVREDPDSRIGIANGVLTVDSLTADRMGVVALTVGQSAAMEYYERIVDQIMSRTRS